MSQGSLPLAGSHATREPSHAGQLGQAVARPASIQAPAPVARRLPPAVPAVRASSLPLGTLTSDDGSLQVSIGTYSDCTGRLPLGAESAAIDTCATGRLYFVGHNPGVFTPLLHIQPGARLTYRDGAGASRVFVIVFRREAWASGAGLPPPVRSGVTAQFQTCVAGDGSVDLILDAVDAPVPSPLSAAAGSQPGVVSAASALTQGVTGLVLGP